MSNKNVHPENILNGDLIDPPDDANAQARLIETEKVLKALSHRSRLMIVQSIGRGEACVSDLQKVVGSDMSTISKHLSVLKNAGIVEDAKRGLQVFYRLRIPCLADFVHCIGSVLSGDPVELPPKLLNVAHADSPTNRMH